MIAIGFMEDVLLEIRIKDIAEDENADVRNSYHGILKVI